MSKTPVQIQGLSQAFGNSVNNAVLLPKVSVTTAIQNRAPCTDFSNDLLPKFGIDRILTQQIMSVPSEQGPNGEPVWKPVNDIHDQVRFVGQWSNNMNSGPAAMLANPSTDPNSFMEIMFYGTGLNVVANMVDNVPVILDVYVDGVAGTSFSYGSKSFILNARNYNPNSITNIVAGLSAGFHTVRLHGKVGNTSPTMISGFEIINASPTITLVPGTSYANGQKLTKAASSTDSYNSNFESGTLGTRGGHVLVYQKSDGSVKKAVTPTDAAPAYLTSANHANEEIVRTHNWREFGAGRADDFSLLSGTTAVQRSFTLDDGTTCLVGNNVDAGNVTLGDLSITNSGAGSFISISFVGTGLDIYATNQSSTKQFDQVLIDGGSSVGALSVAPTSGITCKIASGLPYGTHTIKFYQAGVTFSPAIRNFIVYAPKTPTLPVGAIALSDYFLMANFVANTVNGPTTLSTGVVRKSWSREFVYSGTWAINSDAGTREYYYNYAGASGAYVQYTFCGTGFDFRSIGGSTAVATTNATLTVTRVRDGQVMSLSALSPAPSTYAAATVTLNTTTGQINAAASSGTIYDCGIVVQGLAFDVYTVKILNNVTGNLFVVGIDIITPIHAPKLNGPVIVQNTLSSGSQSIRDLRQISPLQGGQQKMTAQATGITFTSSVATTLASASPLSDMSTAIKTTGNPIDISFSCTLRNSTAGAGCGMQIYVDGVAAGVFSLFNMNAGYDNNYTGRAIVPVAAGFHKVDLLWQSNGSSSLTSQAGSRLLTVREI